MMHLLSVHGCLSLHEYWCILVLSRVCIRLCRGMSVRMYPGYVVAYTRFVQMQLYARMCTQLTTYRIGTLPGWSILCFISDHAYIHTVVICGHTYIHTHIHTYIQTDRDTYRQTYRYTYIHEYIHTYRHTDRHTNIQIYIHT